MSKDIVMPKLSDTMTEGRLISWKKSVGDRVERGEIIAEVETDKANMELEAFSSGVLLETRAKPGEMAAVGTVIAVIGEEGEEPSEEKGGKEDKVEPPEKAEDAAKEDKPAAAGKAPPDAGEEEKKGKKGKVEEAVGEEKDSAVMSEEGRTEKASPLVRRLAREKGIDLQRIEGSGPDGRILREDIEWLLQKKEKAGSSKMDESESAPVATDENKLELSSGESRSLSRIRAAITRTVTRAWQEIPHFAVTVVIDMGEAETVRRELKETGTPVSVNDMIVKGAAMALRKYPQANNSFASNRIKVNNDINIGMVVGLEDGLLVPVIKGCQNLDLKQITSRSRELIELSLGGKIGEADLAGGTFTITNMGMFGVVEFTALIYPPQGAILAVGAVRDEAVVKNGAVCAGRTMRVTLSADHRLMDGTYAARFLQELKRVLENPVSLLV